MQRPGRGSPDVQAEREFTLPLRKSLPRCGLECHHLRLVVARPHMLDLA
jgi:hypothetical protein